MYILSLHIHHPWNTWSTQVNIQYSNLKDKNNTKIYYLLTESEVITEKSQTKALMY